MTGGPVDADECLKVAQKEADYELGYGGVGCCWRKLKLHTSHIFDCCFLSPACVSRLVLT